MRESIHIHRIRPEFLLLLLTIAVLMVPVECYAGPGGEIAEFMFKTRIGRIIGLILAVIFLPLIIYVGIREWLGIRRTKNDLKKLATDFPYFDWTHIEAQVRQTATAMYGVWSTGDLTSLGGRLWPEFHSGQQDILDRWTEEGKQNVTELKKIIKVQPLHLVVEDAESFSQIRVRLYLHLKDYMLHKSSGKIVKGSSKKTVTDYETIWTFIYHSGVWQLSAIDAGDDSLRYAGMQNETDTEFLRENQGTTRYSETAATPKPGRDAVPTAASDLASLDPLEESSSVQQEDAEVDVSDNDENR